MKSGTFPFLIQRLYQDFIKQAHFIVGLINSEQPPVSRLGRPTTIKKIIFRSDID